METPDHILLHEDGARVLMQEGAVAGRCGYQPTSEDNVTCQGGHPIGALHLGECWSPLVLRLRADEVLAVAP